MRTASTGRPPAPSAGSLSRLTADAITLYRRRTGMSAKALYERAGMSAPRYYARMGGRMSLTLNDLEALSNVLGLAPDDMLRMATKLGEVAPSGSGVTR